MKKQDKIELDFEVDELTNSIRNVISGDSFHTDITRITKPDFQRGHEGNVAFISKTQLIDHYIESLGAIHFGGRLMIIDTNAALKLMNRYFSNLAI